MRNLNPEEAEAFIGTINVMRMGPKPGAMRLAIEALGPGQSVLFEKGVDFTLYRKPYYTMRDIARRSTKRFIHVAGNDYKEVLIKREV